MDNVDILYYRQYLLHTIYEILQKTKKNIIKFTHFYFSNILLNRKISWGF